MVLYEYIAAENPGGLFYAGVPLRDLELVDLEQLNAHQVSAVQSSPFYRATAAAAQLVDQTPSDSAGSVPAAVQTAARRSRTTGPSETKEATESTGSAAE